MIGNGYRGLAADNGAGVLLEIKSSTAVDKAVVVAIRNIERRTCWILECRGLVKGGCSCPRERKIA
ncbi:hypothetical protein D3C86_1286750 [compost metagenome]